MAVLAKGSNNKLVVGASSRKLQGSGGGLGAGDTEILELEQGGDFALEQGGDLELEGV